MKNLARRCWSFVVLFVLSLQLFGLQFKEIKARNQYRDDVIAILKNYYSHIKAWTIEGAPELEYVNPQNYKSKKVKLETYMGNIRVGNANFMNLKDPSDNYVAYCVERYKEFPRLNDPMEYHLYDSNSIEEIYKSFKTPRGSQDEVMKGLFRVLYYGYPYDMGKLKEKYKLTDEELELVTAMAVHYWTDSLYGYGKDEKGQDYQYSDMDQWYGIKFEDTVKHHARLGGIYSTSNHIEYDYARHKQGKELLRRVFDELIGVRGQLKTPEYNLNDYQFILLSPRGGREVANYQRLLSLQLRETAVEFVKRDAHSKKLVKGAKYRLTKIDDLPHFASRTKRNYHEFEWTSKDDNNNYTAGPFIIGAGTYLLQELEAPSGYKTASDIKFKVSFTPYKADHKNHRVLQRDEAKITVLEGKVGQDLLFEERGWDNITKDPIARNKVIFETYDEVESKNFEVKKVWKNSNDSTMNKDIPQSVTVRLLADGQPAKHINGKLVEAQNLTSGNGRTVLFRDLPILNDHNNKIVYSVKEENENVVNGKTYVRVDGSLFEVTKHTRDTENDYVEIYNRKIDKKPNGSLATTVLVKDQSANNNQALHLKASDTNSVVVTDKISYKNLMPNTQYKVTATLVKVLDENAIEPSKQYSVVTTKEQTFSTNATGTSSNNDMWSISFDPQTLEQGAKYVVFESAESVNSFEFDLDNNQTAPVNEKHKVEHKNIKDKAQTIVVLSDSEKINIQVTKKWINSNLNQAPILPNSIDVVLKANGENVLGDNGQVLEKSLNASNNWTATFENLPTNKDGKVLIYTVEEKTENNHLVMINEQLFKVYYSDINNNNLSIENTLIPKYTDGTLETFVSVGENRATKDSPVNLSADHAKNIDVVDKLVYSNLRPNTEYNIISSLVKVTDETTNKYNTIREQNSSFTTNEQGRGELDITFKNISLEPSTKYVAFERLVSKKEYEYVNQDNSDIVKRNHIAKEEDITIKSQTIIVEAQPIKQGTLKTTVKVGNKQASTNKALEVKYTKNQKTVVSDTIMYTDLVPNEEYTVTAQLMKVENNDLVKEVAQKVVKLNASHTGSGEWTITFEKTQLEEGAKYVVYESATSTKEFLQQDKETGKNVTKKHTVEHKDPKDLAQTIVVTNEEKPNIPDHPQNPIKLGTLKTTVKVGDKQASENKALEVKYTENQKTVVSDTIMYTDLVPNEEYTVTAQLMKVENNDIVKEVAQKVEKKTTSNTGSGEWTMTFEETQLEEGAKYVVYESATSTKDFLQQNSDGTKTTKKHTVEHKDPKDLAQTIVVTNEEKPNIPNVPIVPDKPEKPNNYNPSLPNTGYIYSSKYFVLSFGSILVALYVSFKKK